MRACRPTMREVDEHVCVDGPTKYAWTTSAIHRPSDGGHRPDRRGTLGRDRYSTRWTSVVEHRSSG